MQNFFTQDSIMLCLNSKAITSPKAKLFVNNQKHKKTEANLKTCLLKQLSAKRNK
jgi:hypothetical protein